MAPFIVPAISNIAMIEGLPIAKESCYGKVGSYGYIEYMKRNLTRNKSILSENDLCKKAKEFNFKRVIKISKNKQNSINKKVYECN